jgi:hypothetical protein
VNLWVVSLLEFYFPESVEVAVFINRCWSTIASAIDSFRLVCEVDASAAVLCLHIDECDVMLWQHRVCNASHFNL